MKTLSDKLTNLSPKSVEKRVSGIFAPGVGLTFTRCEQDAEIGDYFVPILTCEDAQSFRDEWEVNQSQYAHMLNFSETETRELLSHKDLALLVAVEASAHVINVGVTGKFLFSVRTDGQSLILQLADNIPELRPGGEKLAQVQKTQSQDYDPDDLLADYTVDLPKVNRSFRQDFESERRRSENILAQFKAGPWPGSRKELIVTGHYDAKGNIHIDRSHKLRKNIQRNFRNDHFAFFDPKGCSLSVFENGPDIGT